MLQRLALMLLLLILQTGCITYHVYLDEDLKGQSSKAGSFQTGVLVGSQSIDGSKLSLELDLGKSDYTSILSRPKRSIRYRTFSWTDRAIKELKKDFVFGLLSIVLGPPTDLFMIIVTGPYSVIAANLQATDPDPVTHIEEQKTSESPQDGDKAEIGFGDGQVVQGQVEDGLAAFELADIAQQTLAQGKDQLSYGVSLQSRKLPSLAPPLSAGDSLQLRDLIQLAGSSMPKDPESRRQAWQALLNKCPASAKTVRGAIEAEIKKS